MTIFQILILIFAAIVIFKSLKRLMKKEISIWLFSIWFIFWLMVAAVDLFPAMINYLANLAGVGRGVDLVIYLSVIILFYLVFRFNVSLNRLNKSLSKIVREMAIDKAEKKKSDFDK